MSTPPAPAFRGSRDHTIQMVTYLNAILNGETVQRQYVDTKRWCDVGISEIAGSLEYTHFRIKPKLTPAEIAAEEYWAERERLASEIYGVVERVRSGCGKSWCRFSIDGSNNPKQDCGCYDLPATLIRLAGKVAEMNARVATVVLPRNGTYPDTTEAKS